MSQLPSPKCHLLKRLCCLTNMTNLKMIRIVRIQTISSPTQHLPQRPVWQQPVAAVQKSSGETAGCEWTCTWHGEALCSQESHRSPPSTPRPPSTCLLLSYVLLQSHPHLLHLFPSPPPPPSFPNALPVSLWLQAEGSSFSTIFSTHVFYGFPITLS